MATHTARAFSVSLAVLLAAGGAAPALAQDSSAPPAPVRVIVPAGTAGSQPADEAKPAEPEPNYDEAADATKQIAAAVARAKKENKRVLVQWGANWCGWCRLLHNTFKTDRPIARELMYEYEVVLVDIGQWNKNMDLAAGYGADLKGNGVPFLTVLDGDGRAIANQETGELELADKSSPAHDPARVLAFLKEHKAEYLRADDVLAAGLSKAAAEGKRAFVHFGAPWCGWCHRLENWMATEEPSKLLAKDFVDIKIDVDRTIGGKELLQKYRKSGTGGIPWFVFTDEKGAAIVTSDGPAGNVGCPYTDEEIAAFADMLSKAKVRLSGDEIDRLCASMKAAREAEGGH